MGHWALLGSTAMSQQTDPLGPPLAESRSVGAPHSPPPIWLTGILAFTYAGAVGGSLGWAWSTHQTFQIWLTTWAPSVTGVILAVVGFYFGRAGGKSD